MEQPLAGILCQAKMRLTKPRQAVFEALRTAAVPLPISDIARMCPDIDRTTVYRVIETFQQLDIVTAITIGWKQHYELAEPFVPHHHHLFCTICRNAQPIQDAELESFIRTLGDKYNFVAIKHHFELEGTCSHCRNKLSRSSE